MKKTKGLNFEQVLQATIGMIRSAWKVPVCVFLQMNDRGTLDIRAVNGVLARNSKGLNLELQNGIVAHCINKKMVIESGTIPLDDKLASILPRKVRGKGMKFLAVPVSGQSTILGALVLGPVAKEREWKSRHQELLSAGILCAVMSAYCRLYQWMTLSLPQLNQELRTPLTAVQGSLGMVLGGVCGEVGDEVKEMLQMAHRGCERTVSAIEEYINLQAPKK